MFFMFKIIIFYNLPTPLLLFLIVFLLMINIFKNRSLKLPL